MDVSSSPARLDAPVTMSSRDAEPAEIEHYLYENKVLWTEKRRGVLSAAGLRPLVVSPPPEFGGEDLLWNPEQLLLAAANACLMITFAAVAQRARLRWLGYESRAVAHLTPIDEGRYAVTTVEIFPKVELAAGESHERARKLIFKAEDRCLIANSLKARTVVLPEFRTAPSAQLLAVP